MNLNADVGEGAGEDESILACVDSANVACGVHAGSLSITIATAWRCRKLGVEVGAHPGYDDRAGFGRVERSLSGDEIEALVAFQVAGLAAIVPLAYVKPHGALYHRCQRDAAAADALARVAQAYGVGLVGQPGFEIQAAADRAGIPAYREGFADRLMLPDGSLAPRGQSGAVLNPEVAAEQAVSLARSGRYDTICIHGDTKGAAQVAEAVRRALRDAGIETTPLTR
ncbi:MAG: LamB/YcsF family protein [Chloroflexi bacterium]|nr:MAG: LamB/YcsF family protein [Chloroflexota bacterium]TMG66764.1 MAG: LamB/YcsF family protein [Chloroflexota bacterium]